MVGEMEKVVVTGVVGIYSIYIIYLYLYYILCHHGHHRFLLKQLVYKTSFYFPPPFSFFILTHTYSPYITRFSGDRGDRVLKLMSSLEKRRHHSAVTGWFCGDHPGDRMKRVVCQ